MRIAALIFLLFTQAVAAQNYPSPTLKRFNTQAGGSFYSDTGSANPNINRIAGDRLFIGPTSAFGGSFNSVATDPALTTEIKKLHNWAYRDGTLIVESKLGSMAIVGHSQASRASGYPVSYPAAIGVSGFSICDSTVYVPCWGLYGDAVRFASAGFTVAGEFAIVNLGAMANVNPYHTKDGTLKTAGLWVQSGGGLDAAGYDGSLGTVGNADAGVVLLSSYADNSRKFGKGIIIADGALYDQGAGSLVYEVLTTPSRHQWNSYRSNGSIAGTIWTDGTGTGTTSITISDQVVTIGGSFGLKADYLTVDANFYSRLNAGNPNIQMSSNSLIAFNRTNNEFHFTANGVDVFQVNQFAANLSAGKVLAVNGVQVVGSRVTGYAAMTGAANTATTYDTATVTLAQLASRVNALQAALTAHGLIGP